MPSEALEIRGARGGAFSSAFVSAMEDWGMALGPRWACPSHSAESSGSPRSGWAGDAGPAVRRDRLGPPLDVFDDEHFHVTRPLFDLQSELFLDRHQVCRSDAGGLSPGRTRVSGLRRREIE